MKSRYPLTAGALLVLGGFVCTMLGDSTRAQVTTRSSPSSSILQGKGLGSGCVKEFPRVPLLVYDRSGGTLIGAVHTQLTVYSDGLATYSNFDPMSASVASVRVLSAREVAGLVDTLAAVGAHVMCDDPMQVTDVPLATVTVLQGEGADAAAHSFSYYSVSAGAQGIVESIVQDFIAAHF